MKREKQSEAEYLQEVSIRDDMERRWIAEGREARHLGLVLARRGRKRQQLGAECLEVYKQKFMNFQQQRFRYLG